MSTGVPALTSRFAFGNPAKHRRPYLGRGVPGRLRQRRTSASESVFEQGQYKFEVTKLSTISSRRVSELRTADVEIRVRARSEGVDTQKAYGLIFRFEDGDNYYGFWLNPVTGKYRFRKQINDKWNTLIGWTNSDAIKRGEESNLIRVVARGPEMQFHINGLLIDNHTDTSLPSGQVGVSVINIDDDSGAKVFFDDLTVYRTVPYIATPTPVPTVLPPGLLYFEGFDDPDSGWRVLVSDTKEQGYVKGEYRILVEEPGSGVWAQAIPSFTDFDVQVQARNERAQAGNYGLMFRFQDVDNFYVFWVNPSSGNYRVNKWVRNEFTSLRGWGNSPLIPRGNDPMVLRVVARGNMLNFYVNDKLLDGFTDSSLSSGRVGFWVRNDVATDGAEVFFDNLRVFALK